MSRLPYREQLLRVREDAIVDAVNRLLAAKGYDMMTVDEVAAEAGMAKASLYKHFTSKEELAGAAMVRVLDRALEQARALQAQAELAPLQQLEAVVRWALRTQLAGEMPTLPAQNSKLVATLRSNKAYMDRVFELSDLLGDWIQRAQAQGELDATLPPELVLFKVFASACDPVLPLLKAAGHHADEQLVEWLVRTTLHGAKPPPAARPKAPVPAGRRSSAKATAPAPAARKAARR